MWNSAWSGLRRNAYGARRVLQCTGKATMSSSTIPVVDIAPLMDSSPAGRGARQATGAELMRAASSVGFFYIKGHGVSEAVLDGARKHTHKLFTQLPPEALDALHVRHTHSKARGYQHVGENVTQGRRDQHEGFDLYRDDPIVAADATRTRHGLQGVNPWPDEALPEFRPFFEKEYSTAMLALGERLCRGLALGLGLSNEHYFEPFFDQSYWSMRLIRYPQGQQPSADETEELLGCGRHSDYGCWTIVNQDSDPLHEGCLEAETVGGNWLPVPHRPGCLPVNVGDMLAHWTGGLLRATPHRVKPPPLGASARISVPFFYEPNFDALIRPLPVMKTLSSSQANARVSMAYASTNSNIRSGNDSSVKYGDHLLNKVTTNFDFNN